MSLIYRFGEEAQRSMEKAIEIHLRLVDLYKDQPEKRYGQLEEVLLICSSEEALDIKAATSVGSMILKDQTLKY